MKIDIITGAIFLLFHLIMVFNLDVNLDNFVYHEITILMALAGWFFVGKALYYKIKKEALK